jgi:hypothetical protein
LDVALAPAECLWPLEWRRQVAGCNLADRAGKDDAAMRTKPLLGRKAWFGPRQLGWGLSPVSAEGWVVTAAAAAAAVGLAVADRRDRWTALIARKSAIVVIPLVVIVFLKGTSPGGRRAWKEFRASQERGGQ